MGLSQTAIDGIKEIPAPLELSPLLISEERGSQKITVKLFLSDVNIDFIKGSLDAALAELGAKQVDLFILSWPHGMDFEIQEFIELHHFAKVKPEVIQINLESCCVVPP